VVCSILALLLFSLILTPATFFGIQLVKAINVAMQWGYLNPVNGTESGYEEDVCDYIYDLFDGASWSTSNAYWTYTTETNLGQVLQYENHPNSGVGYATNWWVGDFHGSNPTSPGPYGHLYCYGASSDDIRDADVNIYATLYWDPYYGWETVVSKQYFNFIWTCVNGGVYWNDPSGTYDNVLGIVSPDYRYPQNSHPPTVPINTNDEYGFEHSTGVVGMPLAWTDTADLSLDGFNYPYSGDTEYCYIGFESKSPFMGDVATGSGNHYSDFPTAFYYAALGYEDVDHYSFKDALDFASYQTFGTNYLNSRLHNGDWYYRTDSPSGWFHWSMRVLGNGNNGLP